MIKEIIKGDILKSDAEALVNPINCVGVMGKGLALAFKRAYPDNFKAYKKACDAKELKIGVLLIFKIDTLLNPKYIINFPTKQHWREKSKIKDIHFGLFELRDRMIYHQIKSISIPALGCGLGGLDWKTVKPIIARVFNSLPEVDVYLYEPQKQNPVGHQI